MKDDVKFVRYGGLSPLKQEHYLPDGHPDKGFHNPPRKHGLYAMIKGYEELFLIGSTDDPYHISGKSQWLKDDDGNLVEDTRDYDTETQKTIIPPELKKLLKKRKIKENQLRSYKKMMTCPPNTVDVDCDDCPIKIECDLMSEKPCYLTVLKTPKTFSYTGDIWHHLDHAVDPCDVIDRSGDWVKTTYEGFLKAFKKDKHLNIKSSHGSEWSNLDFANYKNNDPYRGIGINYSKDHLEVFIEKL